MVSKKILLGILAMALVFGITVIGCDIIEDDSESSGGGSGGGGTGTVVFKNSFGIDLRKIKLTNGGKQAGYDELLGNNKTKTFSNVPTGLCTIGFQVNSQNASHNFTVSSGETVNINFSSNGNFVITRSGGSGGSDSGGTANADTGSIKFINNSGYATRVGTIIGPSSKGIPAIAKGGNVTVSGVPVGTYTVQISSLRGANLYYWKKTSVNVTKGSTTTVFVTPTGWGL
ncbi:hypothetical protein [Treponema sp. R80B11-R83G3]